MYQNLKVSAITGKTVKGDNDSALKKHNLFCNRSCGFYEFSVLTNSNNDPKVNSMKGLLVNRMYQHCYWNNVLKKFGQNTECGKIRTRITPNTDTFYAVK